MAMLSRWCIKVFHEGEWTLVGGRVQTDEGLQYWFDTYTFTTKIDAEVACKKWRDVFNTEYKPIFVDVEVEV